MPCWTVQKSKIEFLPQSTDASLLTQALQARGFLVENTGTSLRFSKDNRAGSYTVKTGRLALADTWDVNDIKRAYSEQVVESQARKFGWQLQWKTNAAGNREAMVARRG